MTILFDFLGGGGGGMGVVVVGVGHHLTVLFLWSFLCFRFCFKVKVQTIFQGSRGGVSGGGPTFLGDVGRPTFYRFNC